jgi:Zn-dependent metalloprotease
MKKGLLLILLLGIIIPLFGQFKSIRKVDGSAQRFENIGDVTNIKIDDPHGINLPESAEFDFQSIEKQSIELSNLSEAKPVWTANRDIPLAIHGMTGTGPNESATLEEKTFAYLESVKSLLQVEDIQKGFSIKAISTDGLGITHVRLQQYYRGLAFYGGELIVHFKSGDPYFLNGFWYPEAPVETPAQINFRNKTDVKNIVLEDLGNFTHYRDFDKATSKLIAGEQWQIEAVYYQEKNERAPSMCWKVIVHPTIGQEWHYIIDNRSGAIKHKHQAVCNLHYDTEKNKKANPAGVEKAWAKDLAGITRELNVYNHLNTYYLIDASREMFDPGQSSFPDEPIGVIWTLDAKNTSPENSNNFTVEQLSSGNNSWNDPIAVSAHYNAQKAYDYYKSTFNRNSINGQGGNIISLINVVNSDDTEMDNAFWSGIAMFYGNGDTSFHPLAGSLDVAGHEMTHGVIQSTANLEYYAESGAINESFADIFGCMIDRDDWQLGEDVVFDHVFSSGALRDMSDPHNGGSSINDLGYQPKHVSEKYLGEEDNAGVHINSGIPNYVFYLFAESVGKETAEQVYYRALTDYLTKSSKFVDLRIAIEQAAYDMYGSEIKQAASSAFDAAGISGGTSGGNNYQNDLQVNPGNDYVLFVDSNYGDLVLGAGDGSMVMEPLSTTRVRSKPSVSDNGSEIVFIGENKQIHYIYIDWSTGQTEESIIQTDTIWRNVIISKDGWRIAALTEELDNRIHVYDFNLGAWSAYEIINPSTVQGVAGIPVDYVDAMEFNFSGEWIMYDALNKLNSAFSTDIVYWDIGFVHVFDNNANNFANGSVQKLFSGIPENTSIANPTFSKNSPYIIAFDYKVGEHEYYILGTNLETGEVNQIYENVSYSFPNYSRKDNQIVFNYDGFFGLDLAILDVDDTKINYIPNSDKFLFTEASYGVWFSNGTRELVLTAEEVVLPEKEDVTLSPQPVTAKLNIAGDNLSGAFECSIVNMVGEKYMHGHLTFINGKSTIDISSYNIPQGQYVFQLRNDEHLIHKKILILSH